MTLTKEFVDQITPEHGRTSCSDSDLSNSYGGWDGTYDPKTGDKKIRWPRCTRCYLLSNIGEDTENLDFKIIATLEVSDKLRGGNGR